MRYLENYHLPGTVDEALDLLTQYNGTARVIAGGTDLLLDLQSNYNQGQRDQWRALIDVTRMSGAEAIRVDGDWIVVGCGVTHTQLVESQLIQARATALAEACSVVGGPQVRNVATLIGNVAHGLPAADGTIALLALGAEAQVKSSTGQFPAPDQKPEWRPLATLFLGPGISAVDATRELIAAVRFHPTGRGEGSAFDRIMRPQGVALPILALAARVGLRGETIDSVAISVGPVAPVPFRATKTEGVIRGERFSKELIANAIEVLMAETSPRTSPHRATKEYRVELLPALFERTLNRAVERAMG